MTDSVNAFHNFCQAQRYSQHWRLPLEKAVVSSAVHTAASLLNTLPWGTGSSLSLKLINGGNCMRRPKWSIQIGEDPNFTCSQSNVGFKGGMLPVPMADIQKPARLASWRLLSAHVNQQMMTRALLGEQKLAELVTEEGFLLNGRTS